MTLSVWERQEDKSSVHPCASSSAIADGFNLSGVGAAVLGQLGQRGGWGLPAVVVTLLLGLLLISWSRFLCPQGPCVRGGTEQGLC